MTTRLCVCERESPLRVSCPGADRVEHAAQLQTLALRALELIAPSCRLWLFLWILGSRQVKSHEDFPRHIYRLFLLLGIQFRWLLTRGKLASALVTSAELAIDNAKQAVWMEMYAHDHDTLEDLLYRSLQDPWDQLTDSIKVFNDNGGAQQLCDQKVWEAVLTAFPLDHQRMQTDLPARELARMMRWDGDTKRAINLHFASVTELHRTMGFIGTLSIEDVLKSVLLTTLKDSPNSSLRAAYHRVLDALDDGDQDLTFTLIQEHCACEIRPSTSDIDERHPASRGRDPRDHPGTPRRHPGPLGVARPAFNKPSPQPDRTLPDGAMVTYLCNLLDNNDEKPCRVLKAAGLTPKTQADWYTPDTVTMLYTAAQRHMPPALDDSEEADASDTQSEDYDFDAD